MRFLPFSYKLNCVPFPKFVYWSPNSQHNCIWRWSLQQAAVVQLLSCVQLFTTPWAAALQTSLSFTVSCSLLKLIPIGTMMPSNHLILCQPLLLLPSIFPYTRVFSNELALHIRWPKYWSFSFSISPSNDYTGCISFRIDWFHFIALPGTLRKRPLY